MTRTRLDFEGRRKAIVEAAMPLFARHGFAGTTTKEIAKAAAVSEALVFQHFPSKAALYQEILQQGCRGDPGLEALAALRPSTATVVRMTELLLDCFVRGGTSEPTERDCRHRLALNSFLDDGEYLLLLHGWVMERIYPLFRSAMEAAEEAGDLRPDAMPAAANSFWFAQHVAAAIAYARLPDRSTVPYEGEIDRVIADATLFILRGLGLKDEALALHLAAADSAAARAAA